MGIKRLALRPSRLMDIDQEGVLSRDTRLRILQDKILRLHVRFRRSVPNRPHHRTASRPLSAVGWRTIVAWRRSWPFLSSLRRHRLLLHHPRHISIHFVILLTRN